MDAYRCFRYLNGLDQVDYKNITEFSQLIDKLVAYNKSFESRKFKNVLYNRFLIFVIKNKIGFSKYFKKEFFKKIFNSCNFRYVFFYLTKGKY